MKRLALLGSLVISLLSAQVARAQVANETTPLEELNTIKDGEQVSVEFSIKDFSRARRDEILEYWLVPLESVAYVSVSIKSHPAEILEQLGFFINGQRLGWKGNRIHVSGVLERKKLVWRSDGTLESDKALPIQASKDDDADWRPVTVPDGIVKDRNTAYVIHVSKIEDLRVLPLLPRLTPRRRNPQPQLQPGTSQPDR